jgi:hypothetical protein
MVKIESLDALYCRMEEVQTKVYSTGICYNAIHVSFATYASIIMR